MITFKGKPITLVGTQVQVGDKSPDFEVIATDLSPVNGTEFHGKVCIFSAVPSLDTSVCSTETRRFNDEARKLGPEVAVATISMDLPFAQKRWANEHKVDQLKLLSDHRQASFGQAFGVLIQDMRLLARAVFVIDRDGTVRYIQLVEDVTHEPDYDSAISAARQLASEVGAHR